MMTTTIRITIFSLALLGMLTAGICNGQDIARPQNLERDRDLAPPITLNSRIGNPTKQAVLIYYANETAPNAEEQRNFAKIAKWLRSSKNKKLHKIADGIENDVKEFPAAVDKEIAILKQQATNKKSKVSMVIFTNRLAREGKFLAHHAGSGKFVKTSFTLPKLKKLVFRSNPLSHHLTFQVALKAVAKEFSPQENEFVLITKSHGTPHVALTPKLVINANKTTQIAFLKSMLTHLKETGKLSDKQFDEKIAKLNFNKEKHQLLDKENFLSGIGKITIVETKRGKLDPTNDDTLSATGHPRMGITKQQYFTTLQQMGTAANMKFSLVFMEACKSELDGLMLAKLRKQKNSNIGQLYTSDMRGLKYSTVDYTALFKRAEKTRTFADAVHQTLFLKYEEQKAARKKEAKEQKAKEVTRKRVSESLSKGTSKDAKVNHAVSAEQATSALSHIQKDKKWKLLSNGERSRGPAATVYPKVAPATVVVRTLTGHGTGFIIDSKGWIITNHHVIASAPLNMQTGGQVAFIHFGTLRDGMMQPDEKGYLAHVYKSDKAKDLALLKLAQFPKGIKELPVVTFAENNAIPGSDCFAIGHPKSGMLWTLRTGVVSSVGIWPKDTLSLTMTRLAMTATAKKQLTISLATATKRKVMISTCGINPGDSGGPLVNEKGELIAVTYAIPRTDRKSGVTLDKFSYHVHLDEVKAFTKEFPKTVPVVVPSVWPKALMNVLMDKNRDKILDTFAFKTAKGKPFTGLLYDVDQDTPADFNPKDYKQFPRWDFEFVVQTTPFVRTFYDTNNDGSIDLILTDTNKNGLANIVLQRESKEKPWRFVKSKNQLLISPLHFKEVKMQKMFKTFIPPPRKVEKAPEPPKLKPVPKQ